MKRVLVALLLFGTAALGAGPGCGSGEHNHEVDRAEALPDVHENEPGADHEHGHDHAAQTTDHEHDHAHVGTAEHAHDHACIELDPTAAANLGIQVRRVEPETYYNRVKIPGTVTADPDRQAQISTPSSVRVLSLSAPPHATVRAGEPLAELELVDLEIRELQLRAVEARAELLAARTERDRMRTYLEALDRRGGAIDDERRRVQADLEIQEARFRSHRSALDASLEYLKLAGLSRAQLTVLEEHGTVTTRIKVYAPHLAGSPDLEVAARPAVRGETLPAGSPLFELVALDTLRVVGQAFEADLPVVRRAAREGLPVSLLFPAEGRMKHDLRILALEGALDGESHIVHFFVPLPNVLLSEKTLGGVRYHDWQTQAGARAQILVATQEVGRRFVIPARALVRDGGASWVFRKEGDEFVRVAVRVEAIEGRDAVIPLHAGIEPGDELVITGALPVSLALQQGERSPAVDPHAGHSH